jgi:hypothetical protein
VRFGVDEEGEIYVTSKQDGKVRKLVPFLSSIFFISFLLRILEIKVPLNIDEVSWLSRGTLSLSPETTMFFSYITSAIARGTLLSELVQTLIFRRLKWRKSVKFSQSDKREIFWIQDEG